MIAAGTGLIAATAAGPARAAARGRQEAADGTPEQVHLTWGDDPTRTVVVSWASPGQAERPRVRIGQRVIPAAERACIDAPSGAVTWTYHARVDGLRPGATYGYAVTADNDANAADPFSATFTTAPAGRAAFRFTSFGDLAAARPARGHAARRPTRWARWRRFSRCSTCSTATSRTPSPALWARLGRRPGGTSVTTFRRRRRTGRGCRCLVTTSLTAGDGEQGLASYLTRYTLPSNGVDGLEGRWYAFRVGTALFVCLSGDDVAYSAAGAPAAVPCRRRLRQSRRPAARSGGRAPVMAAGSPPVTAGTFSGRGYSGGAQTRWLESTLAAARADASIDWIVVQLHQCACSSAPAGTGSDLGVRREWLPLFDTYEVDLVLSGHDHGYERSFPVRGFDAAAGTDTLTGATHGHPQAPPGDHGGQRGVRHQPGHRAPGPRLRRRRPGSWRVSG